MATLDRWSHLLSGPVTIAFPKLQLIGRDYDPPLVEGSGEMRVANLSKFDFTLRGKPHDPAFAEAQFLRQQLSPYDPLARFRLFGTDANEVEWALGWTIPTVDSSTEEWVLSCQTDGISTVDQSEGTARDSSTELLFVIPPEHPLIRLMRSAPSFVKNGRHVSRVLDTEVMVTYDATRSALSITAQHSEYFPPTFTENWLGEPFRILFGQLIFPRLVARNLGAGRSHVMVRRANRLSTRTTWAALLGRETRLNVESDFWRQYEQLLALIARARDKEGNPNFEANRITRLYEEIIQATTGTRWVWALTLASSIEAIVNMLGAKGLPKEDMSEAVRDKFVEDIATLKSGDERLRQIAINAVNRASKASTIDVLRALVSRDVITANQLDAWQDIRNAVMHGSLVSPYSSQEEDSKLLALVAMMHALTVEVLRLSAHLPSRRFKHEGR
ncbi:MAG: hypothetical protein ACREVV_09730 [Steroidobacteraceae bacterium]